MNWIQVEIDLSEDEPSAKTGDIKGALRIGQYYRGQYAGHYQFLTVAHVWGFFSSGDICLALGADVNRDHWYEMCK